MVRGIRLRHGSRFVAATALLFAVAGNAAFAQEPETFREHKTYRCKVADVVNWDDDGRLRPVSPPKDFYDGIIIDTLTGAVTYQNGIRDQMRVVEYGDHKYDYVLIYPPSWESAAAKVALRTSIRIRVQPPRFLVSSMGTIAAGPCEVVR